MARGRRLAAWEHIAMLAAVMCNCWRGRDAATVRPLDMMPADLRQQIEQQESGDAI